MLGVRSHPIFHYWQILKGKCIGQYNHVFGFNRSLSIDNEQNHMEHGPQISLLEQTQSIHETRLTSRTKCCINM